MSQLFDKPFTIDRTVRLAIICLLGWAAVVLLNQLSGVLLPFVVALLLAYILDPVVCWIQRRVRNNRPVALGITFFIILLLHAAFYAILIPSFIHEVERFQVIFDENRDRIFSGQFIPGHLRMQLKAFFDSEQFHAFFSMDSLRPMLQSALPRLWNSIGNVFGVIGSLVGLIAIWLYLIFLLKDWESFKNQWDSYIPKQFRVQVVGFVDEFNKNMTGYFRQKTIIVFINIVLFTIAFNIIGLPLATLLAIMVGLMNYIPYLQNLGLIPCLLSAGLLSLQSNQPLWVLLLAVLGVFIVIQVLEDAVLVLWLMKEVTGMNPAIMLLSIAIWGSLLGILGMIIALPFSTLLLTYYRRHILVDKMEN